jgi:dienelactone hydrolase
MDGRTVSHYRVLARLGGGGMGVVYKAVDTRLNRPVALKFLPPELTRDEAARRRLVDEAKAASALDHPNICTVYDIDTAPDGQSFIAMGFYDGEALKKRLSNGAIPLVNALDIAIQVANGLAKAHAAGIVHRDIKPANLMITTDGVVKIVDFGIAKVLGNTGETGAGVALGTVAYMSPEQVNAEPVDERTDVWSLGATLYEMLTGRPPFEADHPLALMKAVASKEPVPVRTAKPDLPDDIDRIVRRALAKSPHQRYTSATQFAQALTELRTRLTSPVATTDRATAAPTRRIVIAAAAIAIVAVTGAVAWAVNRSATLRTARERVQEVARLVEADDYTAAFRVAEEVEAHLPDDPALRELWPRFSRTISITTTPPGVRVLTRSYADKDEPWRDLGATPLSGVRVPIGLRRWRFERPGAVPVERAFPAGGPVSTALDHAVNDGEVFVQGGAINSWITGIDPIERIQVPDYRIDKFEVTNKQFKAFLAADGYRKREYWEHAFVIDGATVPWEQGVSKLVDATGRPGPATWELGDYPAGHDNHPVTGVSWYEAAAFAKFSGKRLPTVPHWIRAAGTDFSANIAPLSNLQKATPAAVGTFEGLGPFGTYDMAGNVREWCWNEWGGARYILGATWTDPSYMFTYANALSPWDRSPANGIRLARYPDGMPDVALAPVERLIRDYAKETPVSDELFASYRRQFTYDPAPLNVKSEPAPAASTDYRVEKLSFDAAYGKGRMLAYVFLPPSGVPPYQPVIYFPGSSAIGQPTPPPDLSGFTVKSGRAFIVPVYRGTFDRRDGLPSTWPDQSARYREYAVNWVQDFMRTLEYMSTRTDLDMDRLAYFGMSWGGRWGAIIPAIEPRIKAVILIAGGLASGTAQPEVDQINFVTRVHQPVLMLNGKFDAIEPVESAQRPLFERLGTPKEDKKWVVFDDDHGLPGHRNEVAREALTWLDRYIGPVK